MQKQSSGLSGLERTDFHQSLFSFPGLMQLMKMMVSYCLS